jgi:hypothetical protein
MVEKTSTKLERSGRCIEGSARNIECVLKDVNRTQKEA